MLLSVHGIYTQVKSKIFASLVAVCRHGVEVSLIVLLFVGNADVVKPDGTECT